MGIVKNVYSKSKASYSKWKSEAPKRDAARLDVAKRRLEMEKQRAAIMHEKVKIVKAQSESRKYSQQFRNSGFGGGAMSMQPSGISNPSYFAQKTTAKVKVTKPKVVRRKTKRRKTKVRKPTYIIRGGKAYQVG